MIVINLPYYVPIKNKQNAIILSRDNISDVTNTYINYKGSRIAPSVYYNTDTNAEPIENDFENPENTVWFDIEPYEVFYSYDVDTSDGTNKDKMYDITNKNYIIIKRYDDNTTITTSAGKTIKVFSYSDGTNTYYFNIDDGAKIEIKTNIITNADGTPKYIGTSKQICHIINLDKYTDEGVPHAIIPSPMSLPYVVHDDENGDILTASAKSIFTIKYGEYEITDNQFKAYYDTNTGDKREHVILYSPLPSCDNGLYGVYTITKDYNLLYELKKDSLPNDWDIAIIRLTKMDHLDVPKRTENLMGVQYPPCYTDIVNMFDKLGNYDMESQDPIVYAVHYKNGTPVGTTRLGFINEATEIIIRRDQYSATESTIDDLYIVVGSTKKKINIGICDIRFYKKSTV